MEKKKLLVVGMSAIAVMLAGVSAVSAYQGDYTKKGPDHTAEREAQMIKIFDTVDYQSWKEMMDGRGRITDVINEDNFATFVEARTLGKAGNVVEADKLRQKLGLRTSNGERAGRGHGKKSGNRGNRHEGQRGQNNGGNFVDSNSDGVCDNMNE
jgi:hypothetical protein